jgi:hypothetical protein
VSKPSVNQPYISASIERKVIIATRVGTEVTWIDVYIDGNYLASSPPDSFTWNSSSVANGFHNISATAFEYPGTAIGASSITVSVAN